MTCATSTPLTVEPQRHRHAIGVEDVDHVPALGLGVGADVGLALVAGPGLLDLVVHLTPPAARPRPSRPRGCAGGSRRPCGISRSAPRGPAPPRTSGRLRAVPPGSSPPPP